MVYRLDTLYPNPCDQCGSREEVRFYWQVAQQQYRPFCYNCQVLHWLEAERLWRETHGGDAPLPKVS